MRKIVLNILIILVSFSLTNLAIAEEKNSQEAELNFYVGMFDFSDTKQSAGLFGLIVVGFGGIWFTFAIQLIIHLALHQ